LFDLIACPQREASINNKNLITHGKCEKSSGGNAPSCFTKDNAT